MVTKYHSFCSSLWSDFFPKSLRPYCEKKKKFWQTLTPCNLSREKILLLLLGNLNAHHVAYPKKDWVVFANDFVNNGLGLDRSQTTTQIEHYDNLAALVKLITCFHDSLIYESTIFSLRNFLCLVFSQCRSFLLRSKIEVKNITDITLYCYRKWNLKFREKKS